MSRHSLQVLFLICSEQFANYPLEIVYPATEKVDPTSVYSVGVP